MDERNLYYVGGLNELHTFSLYTTQKLNLTLSSASYMVMNQSQNRTVSLLQSPISLDIKNLPDEYQEYLFRNDDLLVGYILSLHRYSELENSLLESLEHLTQMIQQIQVMFHDYRSVTDRIQDQVHLLDNAFKEFLSLETYQYQLLASNYHQGSLKQRLKSNIEEYKTRSAGISMEFVNDSANSISHVLNNFKNNRKVHHLTQEKLYRWMEERVSGFV